MALHPNSVSANLDDFTYKYLRAAADAEDRVLAAQIRRVLRTWAEWHSRSDNSYETDLESVDPGWDQLPLPDADATQAMSVPEEGVV
jgi:hypothetical protein